LILNKLYKKCITFVSLNLGFTQLEVFRSLPTVYFCQPHDLSYTNLYKTRVANESYQKTPQSQQLAAEKEGVGRSTLLLSVAAVQPSSGKTVIFTFSLSSSLPNWSNKHDEAIYTYISNQLDVTFSKFFHFIFATLHVSGVPCPSSGVSLLHW
jgi:spore germination protein YaaH